MILSVDTGLKNFGCAVIEESGNIVHVETIRTKKTKNKKIRAAEDYSQRITSICKRLNELIEEYPIDCVTGELPPFGSQSSTAAISLTAGATIILSLCESKGIPTTWVSPRELKQFFTGNPNADKKQIMNEVCKIYNWKKTIKPIKEKLSKKIIRFDTMYHVMGKSLTGSVFEHIADSIAAYYACIGQGVYNV